MGAWGLSVYGNDVALDFSTTIVDFLLEQADSPERMRVAAEIMANSHIGRDLAHDFIKDDAEVENWPSAAQIIQERLRSVGDDWYARWSNPDEMRARVAAQIEALDNPPKDDGPGLMEQMANFLGGER